MGWDIVYMTEFYNKKTKQWQPAQDVQLFYTPSADGMTLESCRNVGEYDLLAGKSTRDYNVFRILSGVRLENEESSVAVFNTDPKGFPEDVHELTRNVLNCDAYDDTINYATLAELETYFEEKKEDIVKYFGSEYTAFLWFIDALNKIRIELIERMNDDDFLVRKDEFRIIYGYNY